MAYISMYMVRNETPVVTFEQVRSPTSAVADRYFAVQGTQLYYLGITCDTCAFLFQKRGYVYRLSPTDVAARLATGQDLLDPDLLASVGSLLPADSYGVVETLFVPALSGPCAPNDYFAHEAVAFTGLDPTWGVPEHPRVQYWRAGESRLPVGAGGHRVRVHAGVESRPSPQRFFHFVVPMEPPHVFDRDQIAFYRAKLEAGDTPAALGVSVLDLRAKAMWPGRGADPELLDGVEWCLTTFLLDGHHKMQAAAEAQLPIQLLTFVARRPSVAEEADIPVVLAEMASWRNG